jgi:hypothetical protein
MLQAIRLQPRSQTHWGQFRETLAFVKAGRGG